MTVIRSLGQNPKNDEIQKILIELKLNQLNEINFIQFCNIIKKLINENDIKNDIKNDMIEAFNIFDKDGTGYISKKALKEIMSSLGKNLEQGNHYWDDEPVKKELKDDEENDMMSLEEFISMMT
mmetsp:Transcript_7805/g.9283  ORF Transcript_7805/g.9283 Transcript_7805/m.9283 type:complete len:124 (+) Transcript_7805:599-970(+)